MRIISQDLSIDIDYESNSFVIEESTDHFEIIVIDDRILAPLAKYSTEEKATKALKMMRDKYARFLIIDNNDYMSVTNDIIYDLDRPFNKIEIKEFKGFVFVLPKEEDI